jgi:EAL domain-containing protein (putative c-di-GMP-specific phosphodiesterase class I)/CRP-like cAMP-binding protein
MPDPRKLQDDAARAAADGDWVTAARLYALLEKGTPHEGAWPLRLAESQRKLGQNGEAEAALTRALKVFVRQHKRNKAVAVCRLMLEINPRNPQVAPVLEWLDRQHDEEPEPAAEPAAAPAPAEPPRASGSFTVPAWMKRAERLRMSAERPEDADQTTSAPGPAEPGPAVPRVVMPRTKFFSALSERQLRTVNERASLLELAPGQILYDEGDPAKALFVVAAGQITLLLPQEVGRLGRGDFFGEEVAVLPEQPCLTTARAVAAAQVLALERALVDGLVRETPALLDLLATSLRDRLVRRYAIASPWLASLAQAEREALLARLVFCEVERGGPLYDSHDADAGLVLLLAGEATAGLDGRMSELLRAGDIFGEIAHVTASDVHAIATASTKCLVLRLGRAELATLEADHPEVRDHLAALAESRLCRLQEAKNVQLTISQSLAIPLHVLLLHGDTVTLHVCEGALSAANLLVDSASETAVALRLLANERFDVLICSVDLLKGSDVDLLTELRRRDLDVPIILTTSDPGLDTAGAAATHGVVQTLLEPISLPELLATASRAGQFNRLTRLRRQALARLNPTGEWMGDQTGLEVHFPITLDHLWMAFQPIVSCSAGDVVAFEALLRSGDDLLPSPLAVLRAAERLRRVHDVGRIIRDKVAAVAARSSKAPILCINVHRQDLLDPHLLDPKSPLSAIASRVVLEVTERTPLDELSDLRARLGALRSLGYRFALDNLGAGHAGVATLVQLEPDLAKLDLSLIRGLSEDAEKQQLVRDMLELCRDMNVQVVCEGVETPRELDALLAMGADLMQGYLFAKPGPPFPAVDPQRLPRRK